MSASPNPNSVHPAAEHEPAAEVSASDLVFTGILRGIEARTFVPGQRLVENDLATQFSVGRNSVREAFQRLAAEGLVELLRYRGAVIRLLSMQETLDVLDVAEHMTALLARTAVRGKGDRLLAQALRGVVQELEAADARHDAEAFGAARRRLYRTLLDMGGSRELRRLFPTIHMPIVYAQHRLPTLQKLRLADYRQLAKAVLDGDADGAERAGSAHVRNVRAAILQESGLAGLP